MTQTGKEYAEALFALARETGSEAEFSQALDQILTCFQENPQYGELLSSPEIPSEERKELLTKAFGGETPEYVLSFLMLLCEHRRVRALEECVKEYQALYQIYQSVVRAKITSAVSLTENEKSVLMAKLRALSGKEIEPEYIVDASLLGGVVVEMDGKRIDGSLRRKLKDLKEVIDQ